MNTIFVGKKNFQIEEELFTKNPQDIVFILHEALLLLNFLQPKPQVENTNKNYYDLY